MSVTLCNTTQANHTFGDGLPLIEAAPVLQGRNEAAHVNLALAMYSIDGRQRDTSSSRRNLRLQ